MHDSDALIKDAAKAALMIKKAKNILIVAHIDADGITSAAIAVRTCQRINKEHKVLFANKMDDATIKTINNSDDDLVWIVDLGSGYLSKFTRNGIVITDHHVPDPNWRKGRTSLDDFKIMEHVNAHNYGMNGSVDACGASTTYLVSRCIDEKNKDLACLAVVGACGDLQDRVNGELVGINKIALNDAIDCGDVVAEIDVRLFGRETRPLVQFIQYSTDPMFKGLSNDTNACNSFFKELKIELKKGNSYRTWNSLTKKEKEKVTNALLKHLDNENKDALIGEVYTLPRFPHDNGLRDSKEFATVLNSCGRYDDADTGLRICFGEATAIKDAEENRAEHKRNISAAIQYVKDNNLVKKRNCIQYFDAENAIKDTVVGIVAGMLLNTDGCDRNIPILGFANSDDGVKVSARANRALGEKGLDLSMIMNKASELVGGYGGGHSVAAGATIPEDKKEKFLIIVEDLVASQII